MSLSNGHGADLTPEPRLDDHPDVYEHKQQQCNECEKVDCASGLVTAEQVQQRRK
jgi:hypothetical protein